VRAASNSRAFRARPGAGLLLSLGLMLTALCSVPIGAVEQRRIDPPAPGPIGVWRNADGQPFRFDGKSSIAIDDPILDLPNGSSWTLEAWIYFPSLSPANIVGKRGVCGPGDGFYQIAIDHNAPGTGMGVDPRWVQVNAWNHIAIAMHGNSGWVVYANGVATKTVNSPGWRIKNSGQFRIGGSGTCKGFAGYIQEVSLYDRELSANEVQRLFALGMNAPITAARPTAVPPAASVAPASASSAPATIASTPAPPSPGPIGVWRDPSGQPYHFDGRNSITIDSPVVDLPDGSSWTLETWAFITSLDDANLIGKRGRCEDGAPFYQIGLWHDARGAGMYVDPQFVRLNDWNHLAIVGHGRSGWTVYANGVPTKTVNQPGWRIHNSAPFRIGTSGTCKGFTGDIQEVSLYDRELSAQEVRQLFLLGRNAPITAAARPGAVPAVASAPAPPGSLASLTAASTEDAWIPQKRLALVIGNSRYGVAGATGGAVTWPDLEQGPIKDADAIAVRLRALGFEVAEFKDQNIDQMNADLRAFADRIAAAPDGLALFYYSGHGARAPRDIGNDGEETYLIPVGTNLEYDVDAHSKAVGLVEVRNVMRRSRAGVVILDACRNNALRRPPTRAAGTRGLAAPENISGMLFAYSTSAGDVADNRPGEMSEYTELLVRELGLPGQSLTGSFRKVRKQIAQLHNSRLPELTDELNDDVVLMPLGAPH